MLGSMRSSTISTPAIRLDVPHAPKGARQCSCGLLQLPSLLPVAVSVLLSNPMPMGPANAPGLILTAAAGCRCPTGLRLPHRSGAVGSGRSLSVSIAPGAPGQGPVAAVVSPAPALGPDPECSPPPVTFQKVGLTSLAMLDARVSLPVTQQPATHSLHLSAEPALTLPAFCIALPCSSCMCGLSVRRNAAVQITAMGAAKTQLTWSRTILLGIIGGAFISFGALFALSVGCCCPGIAAADPGGWPACV